MHDVEQCITAQLLSFAYGAYESGRGASGMPNERTNHANQGSACAVPDGAVRLLGVRYAATVRWTGSAYNGMAVLTLRQ
jgi:hypothetical protein